MQAGQLAWLAGRGPHLPQEHGVSPPLWPAPLSRTSSLAPGAVWTLWPHHMPGEEENMRGEGQNPNMRGCSFSACLVSGSLSW